MHGGPLEMTVRVDFPEEVTSGQNPEWRQERTT